jgi:tripartite ATP-independent transporter DctP family solute receptor
MKTILKTLLLTAALIPGAVQAEEIILGHGAAPTNPRHLAAKMFGALVDTCTNGEITVSVADSGTMGDDVELLTSTASGVIQMTANSQGATGQIVPEINAIGLPFLFADAPTAWRVLDGDVGAMIDEKAQAAGLKVLAFWDNGIRHVSHMSKSIITPADLAGMKIRTPPDDMTIAIFTALGANPAPLAFAELPTALQSGVFEGQENPLTNIYSSKIHEITKYISLTAHKYESAPLLASMAWWSSLSQENQDCVQKAATASMWYQRGLSWEASSALVEPLKAEGVTLTEVADRQAFIDATAPVYDDYAAQFPDLVAKLREEAAK